MKKILLITLLIAIVSTFAFAAIQAPTFLGTAGVVCPNAGWDTSACRANAPAESVQPVTARIYPPIFTPNVGWNG
jgi:hypothetical protein